MANLDQLLVAMADVEASDLHLVVGQKPKYRIHGQIVTVEEEPVTDEETLGNYLSHVMTEKQRSEYENNRDVDLAYSVDDHHRFRCSYFFQRTGYGAVFRLIPSEILTLDQLQMPEVLKRLSNLRSGLVLVTGPTGCGKSTTLAAMIDHVNSTQRRHILTIEDPVEFVHRNKKSILTHRQVGIHTNSFSAALRAVTRQDADVVLVGELRDLETMSLALSAAAMGIVVYGTLHTSSAAKTIDRVIENFPTEQQSQVRTVLAESLRGIVCQELIRRKDDKGRVAATEILLGNPGVANIIREGNTLKIASVLQAGGKEGMQTMDDELERLLQTDVISADEAYLKAADKRRFEHLISNN